jgi:hypothetical protein
MPMIQEQEIVKESRSLFGLGKLPYVPTELRYQNTILYFMVSSNRRKNKTISEDRIVSSKRIKTT